MVSALGASIFLQNALMLIYGARYQVYPDILPQTQVSILGQQVPVMRIAVVLVSLTIMAALYLFVQKTKVGTAIRAAAIDQGAARLMGIDVNKVIRLVFVIGPALGGGAGLLVGLYYGQISFTMGWLYGMKAFTAAILGGIGNIPGAMVGGLLLGVVEALGATYLSIAWKDAIAFFVLILILIVRPSGLLGERVAEKVVMAAWSRKRGLVAGYVLAAAGIAAAPLFLDAYWLDVLNSVGLYVLLALSLNLILGDAGLFNMGHAAFYAVGAYTTAILNTRLQIPILWTLPASAVVAAIFAVLVARPVVHLRGDYLLVVTIGLGEIVRIALVNDVFGLTGGANGIFGISRPTLVRYCGSAGRTSSST